MFYSQFILAKKGPLGTIWIAAHLERKLRKNQVADTDIGVSVDSILFPEVPIALRLSSHLLLGVVRIYSRKVNYLFHDCSEALLKIKQAFRSTAVDLPPEESTAPYHSITLPETFDLDDFELPDNAFFHGNSVDHHVSTREQITLQDTMEGMVYSTSQFGLDERFGDGDASQIGLDLDEDLFLEKVSSGHPSAPLGLEEDADPDFSAQPVTFTEMDIDGVETSKDQPEHFASGCGIDSNILDSKEADDSSCLHDDQIQTQDLNEGLLHSDLSEGPSGVPGIMDFPFNAAKVPSSDVNECAQAPSTPGLITEAVPSLNLLRKTSIHNAVEDVIGEPSSESVDTDSTKLMPEENLGNLVNEPCHHIDGMKPGLDCTSLSGEKCETDIHPLKNMENESSCGARQDVHVKLPEDGPSSSVGLISSDLIQSVSSPTSVLSEPKSVSPAPDCSGENYPSADLADMELELKQMQEALPSKIRAEFNKSDECLDGVSSNDNQLGALHHLAISEIPAPETLLMATTEASDLPNDSVLQLTADEPVTSEGTADRFESLSGKKRRLMESTPVFEDGSASKFSRMLRSRSIVDYIPDDDDVLASILVGKRTPVLKMRPSPPPAEVVSSKRPRLTPRVNVLKRKVLLDDDMILHAEVIREQLANTEDIRRMRRKAPCTRKEIWMIQKYLSEEEILSKPLLTGLSAVLTILQNQTYYPTETGVSPSDAKQSHLEAVEELEFSKRAEFIERTVVERIDGPIAAMPDRSATAASEPTETLTQMENHTSEHAISSLVSDNEKQIEASMEIEMPNKGANDAVNHAAAIGVEMPILTDSLPGDGCNISADTLRIETTLMDKNDRMQTTPQKDDGSCLSPDEKLVIEPTDDLRVEPTDDLRDEISILDKVIERDESVADEIKCIISDDVALPQDCHDGVKEVANDEILVPLPDNCSVETGPDVISDSLTTNANPYIPDVAMEIIGLTGMAVVTDDNDGGRVSTAEIGVAVRDAAARRMINNEGDLSSSPLCMEETQIDSSCPLQLNLDMENGTSNGEGPGCQGGHLESAINLEMLTAVISAEGDSGDFGHIIDENDTDFLNADDEAGLMEEDDDMPTGDEGRSIENSGWSSRTRAVAGYLRSLFDNETGRGIKMVLMDNLLAGKTRKEASRMFFETLVLKTKDYIHVEQENPFEKIDIQPRAKIMKSEF